MRTLIPSIKDKNYVYVLGEEEDWRYLNEDVLSHKIRKFDTYGDGMTQHCPTYEAPVTDLLDFCYSLASVRRELLKINEEDLGFCLSLPHDNTSRQTLDFLSKVKFNESKNKTEYFNFREEKISSSNKYEHDRRWAVIPSFLNGTDPIRDAFWVLQNNHSLGFGDLIKMIKFFKIADYFEEVQISYDRRKSFANMFPRHVDAFDGSDWDCVHEYSQAISLYNRIYRIIDSLSSIQRSIDCYNNNVQNRMEYRQAQQKLLEQKQQEQKELVTA